MTKPFLDAVRGSYAQRRRLVAPLMGFPGVKLAGTTVKLAQQNYAEHFRVLKALVETFNPDVIFPLMDLSVEANALGRYTIFPKEDSATVVKGEFTREDLEMAGKIDICSDARLLGYVETMRLMTSHLPGGIIRGAYVTGPYTLAALLMGADEAAIATVMNCEMLHEICDMTVAKIAQYVQLLVKAGAQLICVLEPSAVMLGPAQFEEYSGSYVRKISSEYSRSDIAFVYHVCGNSMHLIEVMASSAVDAISLDSTEAGVDLLRAATKVQNEIVFIGNLSPTGSILGGHPGEVERETSALLDEMESCPNFVLSTGCDLPQETPHENIEAFMNAGRSYMIN